VAFATLVRLQGPAARCAITGITPIAGLASTVGWPMTAWMEAQIGWRGACLVWAGLYLLLGLPLNWRLPGLASAAPRLAFESIAAAPAIGALPSAPSPPVHPALLTALLGLFVAVSLFIGTARATHLPQLLLAGPAGAAPFALLHGAGNGILTIAKGTRPLALPGAQGYGERRGWLLLPARVAQAAAPFAFGLALDAWGGGAPWLSDGLRMLAFLVLMALPRLKPS